MWVVHVSLLMRMFSLTASISQEVASKLVLGLNFDATVLECLHQITSLLSYKCLFRIIQVTVQREISIK